MKTASLVLGLWAALTAASDMPPVVVTRVVETFKWKQPFGGGGFETPKGFRAICEMMGTFRATQHVLHDLDKEPPLGLAPWANALKYFFGGRPFPGSWDGVDHTGANREVIMMEYAQVPQAVKDWIEKAKEDEFGEERYLFGVYDKPKKEGDKITGLADLKTGKDEDKVILFAAGALYEVLPLWVADVSGCSDQFKDLSRYHAEPEDQGIVAWPVYRTEPLYSENSAHILFNIKGQVLEKVWTEEEIAAKAAKEAAEAEASSTQDAAVEPTETKVESKDSASSDSQAATSSETGAAERPTAEAEVPSTKVPEVPHENHEKDEL